MHRRGERMSAHIPPCDVETNGGECCCASVWRDRAQSAQLAAAHSGNDLLAMGLLCGQREDEYPRQSCGRVENDKHLGDCSAPRGPCDRCGTLNATRRREGPFVFCYDRTGCNARKAGRRPDSASAAIPDKLMHELTKRWDVPMPFADARQALREAYESGFKAGARTEPARPEHVGPDWKPGMCESCETRPASRWCNGCIIEDHEAAQGSETTLPPSLVDLLQELFGYFQCGDTRIDKDYVTRIKRALETGGEE
jgi:hypothetical protein